MRDFANGNSNSEELEKPAKKTIFLSTESDKTFLGAGEARLLEAIEAADSHKDHTIIFAFGGEPVSRDELYKLKGKLDQHATEKFKHAVNNFENPYDGGCLSEDTQKLIGLSGKAGLSILDNACPPASCHIINPDRTVEFEADVWKIPAEHEALRVQSIGAEGK
jgi:hypothetical protein